MFVGICSQTPKALEHVAQTGILQQLVNEISKDDVLVQLNALDLLTDIAFSEHGLLFLEQQGIVGNFERMLGAVEVEPMSSFLLPGKCKVKRCFSFTTIELVK